MIKAKAYCKIIYQFGKDTDKLVLVSEIEQS